MTPQQIRQFIDQYGDHSDYLDIVSYSESVLLRASPTVKGPMAVFISRTDRKPTDSRIGKINICNAAVFEVYGKQFPEIDMYRTRSIFATNQWKVVLTYLAQHTNTPFAVSTIVSDENSILASRLYALIPKNGTLFVIAHEQDSMNSNDEIFTAISVQFQQRVYDSDVRLSRDGMAFAPTIWDVIRHFDLEDGQMSARDILLHSDPVMVMLRDAIRDPIVQAKVRSKITATTSIHGLLNTMGQHKQGVEIAIVDAKVPGINVRLLVPTGELDADEIAIALSELGAI